MTPSIHETDPLDRLDPVRLAATRWFVALRDENADEALIAEFEVWCAADPCNVQTYDRIEKLWGASDGLAALNGTTHRRGLIGGAAGALAVLAGGRLLMQAHPFADYRAGTGQLRTAMLPDGSRVEMASQSALSVSFSPDRRRVKLLSGEAWFKVARDPSRPFEVAAAGGRITALGTAFAVATDDTSTQVTVTEHAVRVVLAGQAVRLEDGYSLRYAKARIGPTLTADENALAWRTGRLVFVSRPLSEVVRVLDRWAGGRTIIADKALAAREVTLMVSVANAGDGVARLAESLPVRVRRITPLMTVISKI
ncbi:FecR family protein [Asticcacaulis endophyticus]|uniref:Iron dicitrate transporter FecR n=1 Tax=Asticcacaulis endophyticus TaxID=1395890 RepID=A0A918Q471_9CAUL|nr:FecR domain-containing protein [Asticcacaulis endophyticus]GGZ32674.1 iron dicitrate transporter FecR [Asticcacaulis endophyticus]